MRIALLPQVTFPNVTTESAYAWALSLAESLCKRGHQTLIFGPSQGYEAQLPVIPGNAYINLPRIGSFVGLHPSIGELLEWLHPRMGKTVVDMVYGTQVVTAGAYVQSMPDCKACDRPAVVVNDFFAYGPYQTTTRSQFKALRCGGESPIVYAELRNLAYLAVDGLFFDTPLEKKNGFEGARRLLSAYAMREIDKKSYVMPGGVPSKMAWDYLEKYKDEKFEDHTLFFGARLNFTKRPEMMLRNYVKHVAYGRPPQIIVTSPKGDDKFMSEQPKELQDLVQFKTNLSSDEFLRLAAKSHVCVYTSKGEGLSFGVLQMISAGLVMIFPDLPWVHALLGPSLKDYPFLFKNDDDILGMLRYCYEHYPAAVANMLPIREYVREKYDQTKCTDDIEIRLTDIEESLWKPIFEKKFQSNSAWQIIRDSGQKMPAKFTMDEVLQQIGKDAIVIRPKSVKTVSTLNVKYPSQVTVRRVLKFCGIADMEPGVEPVFVRL